MLTGDPATAPRTRPARQGAAHRPDLAWRAARRQLGRLRDPRHLAAVAILVACGAALLVFTLVRGDLAGADARAYWAGVRTWLAGGDPYHPTGPFLPYVYAPWMLPLFLPWALLPWDVAWFLWRGLNVLLFAWTLDWAFRRHALATALMVLLLLLPLATTFDTGNVTLFLALAVWAAQFVAPRWGGVLWALAASMKWFPALLFVLLPPRARLWGLLAAGVALLLALATWPQTLVQVETAINFPRPLRIDYLLLAWAAVPWVWRHPHPFWWLNRRELPGALRAARAAAGRWLGAFRTRPEATTRAARRGVEARLRAFFGLG